MILCMSCLQSWSQSKGAPFDPEVCVEACRPILPIFALDSPNHPPKPANPWVRKRGKVWWEVSNFQKPKPNFEFNEGTTLVPQCSTTIMSLWHQFPGNHDVEVQTHHFHILESPAWTPNFWMLWLKTKMVSCHGKAETLPKTEQKWNSALIHMFPANWSINCNKSNRKGG